MGSVFLKHNLHCVVFCPFMCWLRPKQTCGADRRVRVSPSLQRDVILSFMEEHAKTGNKKFPRKGKLPLADAIANEMKIPVSNVRAWVKKAPSILKKAGEIDAAMVMGVKQRKLCKQIKASFNFKEPSMRPLTDYMAQDP